MSLRLKKTLFLIGDVLLLLVIVFLALYLFFESRFDNKIYPNIYLNDVNLGGLSLDEAKSVLEKKIEHFDSIGIRILSDQEEVLWRRSVFSFDPDLSSQTVFFNINKTLDDAFLLGRGDNLFKDFYFKFSSFFFKRQIPLSFVLDEAEIKKYLEDSFAESIVLAQDAKLISSYSLIGSSTENVLIKDEIGTTTISLLSSQPHSSVRQAQLESEGDKRIVFLVSPEVEGQQIDYNLFFKEFKNNLSNLKNNNIYLKIINTYPKIKVDDIEELKGGAYNLLELAPINLIYKDKQTEKIFEISKEVFSTWLDVQFNEESSEIFLSLDFEKFFSFLENNVAFEVEKEPIKPQFEFKDDKVSLFFPGQDGLKINKEESFNNLLEAFNKKDFSQLFLVVEVSEIESLDGINTMGIKELIGSGHSNFAGSSANRRHNIKVGAEKLSGVIIKPGEEFSLVTALGPTTREAGYLPEYVIKGNKTVLEYGGGLCQVATTLFRSALGSGLPITERKNHSYRVSYYEPAGMDATVYSPRPDLKFKNDTEHNILIQARFEGSNDMYFDFWGTSDGRLATTTKPVMYNIIRPGPTQIIETTDLKPGQKKCTESARSGAETYFDYTVIYKAGTLEENKIETRFHSKYVPWREVCLVGVEPKVEVEEAPVE